MKTPIRTLGLAAICVMLMGVIPAAEAQTVPACAGVGGASIALDGAPTITTDAGGNTIQPITGSASVVFDFIYKAETQSRAINQIPITIGHKASVPWLVTSVGTSKTFVTLAPDSQGAVEEPFSVKVDVIATDQAPAFAPGNVVVEVSADEGTCVDAVPTSPFEAQLKAGFYENWQAKFQSAIWKTGQNERLQIPLIVNNFGNGHIKVKLSPAEGTSKSLNYAMPGDTTVESEIAGGSLTEASIPVDVQTPFKNGYENRRDQLNIKVTGSYFADPNQKLTDVDLQAVIQTQGVYVPGFDAVAMLGAAIGAALIARRRL